MNKLLNKDLNSLVFSSIPRYGLDIIFLILFCAVCLAFNYDDVIFERPYGNHQWRQTDCASMALNYHQDDVPFMEPQMHFRLNEKGEAVGEFPILYFIVGKLYDAFGYHEFIYRLLWLIISFIGSFSLFRLAYSMLRLPFESLMIGLMLILSPAVAFYSISFISDPPALYFAGVGLLFVFNANKSSSFRFFYAGILMFVLAGLLKASALIVPFSALGVASLYFLSKREWKRLIHVAMGFSGIVFINYLWYSYANDFNYEHGTNYFFIRTAPAWEMTKDAFWELADIIYRVRLAEFSNRVLFFPPLAVILLGVILRKINLWWSLFFASVMAASLLYFFAFFQQFRYHDYYLINPVLMVPLMYLIAYSVLLKINPEIRKGIAQIALIGIIVHSFLLTKNRTVSRYESPESNFFLGKGYGHIEPYLNEIGVGREDLVISLPDESPNISLYLMNRKGWTNLYHNKIDAGDITYFKKAGAKYLIIGDDKLLEDPEIESFAQDEIGSYKGIKIFKL